jgi:hypothetical protein
MRISFHDFLTRHTNQCIFRGIAYVHSMGDTRLGGGARARASTPHPQPDIAASEMRASPSPLAP